MLPVKSTEEAPDVDARDEMALDLSPSIAKDNLCFFIQ
jgi:hypothetical protein